jgi:hypothetical protein
MGEMPIHLDDVDVASEVAGLSSVLIVPCNMCPAINRAVSEEEPFIQLFRNFLKSAPFEQHLKELQSQLVEQGIRTDIFASNIPYQWFLCMWTSGRRKKLQEHARQYEAVMVMGCDSATATVRDAVKGTNAKVIEGMEVVGFMNAQMKFHLPCSISFEECTMVPMAQQEKEEDISA